MIQAAGILFLAPGNKALFLKRSFAGDHGGDWCFPGGKVEKGELPEDAAERETSEELGFLFEGLRVEHTRQINDEVDYTTFLQRVGKQFTPSLDKEHIGFAWAPLDQPPQPLHPGCEIALKRLGMDELQVAKAIAAGDVVSPQRFGDMSLYAMRISGTGLSYRKGIDEYVWRDPEIYLSQDMIDRCAGLPVIWEHPPKSMLTSDEFAKRIVGTVMFAYPKDKELWGITRIYDQEAIDLMDTEQLSTSPAVVFKDPSVNKKTEFEGKDLLIEGKPTLLDHLAICAKGVWDKGGEPTGIENVEVVKTDSEPNFPPGSVPQELAQRANECGQIRDSAMAEEKKVDAEKEEKEMKKEDAAKADTAKADAAKADAEAGEKLDKILECLDSLGKRMDAYDAKRDAEEKKPVEEKGESEKLPFTKDSKKKDGEEEKEMKEKGEPEEIKADKKHKKDGAEAAMMSDKKKDAEDEKEKEEEKKDAARMDSDVKYAELKKEFDALKAHMPRNISDEDRDAISEAQAKAEQIYSAFGDSAPRPMQNEQPIEYRRRLLSKLKVHSPSFKDADIKVLAMAPEVFKIAEDQIYKDAWTAAITPDDVDGLGGLREVRRVNRDTGHVIKEFYGQPMAWMSQFTGGRRLARFNLGNKG